MVRSTIRRAAVAAVVFIPATMSAAPAHADNTRLNNGVVANVYTVQHQAGCSTNIRKDPALTLAAQWYSRDILNNRNLPDVNIGSDGSTPQSRAEAAGFRGQVAQTVAINPALAINNIDVINQWYYDPGYLAIMSDCANTAIGVWSAVGAGHRRATVNNHGWITAVQLWLVSNPDMLCSFAVGDRVANSAVPQPR